MGDIDSSIISLYENFTKNKTPSLLINTNIKIIIPEYS